MIDEPEPGPSAQLVSDLRDALRKRAAAERRLIEQYGGVEQDAQAQIDAAVQLIRGRFETTRAAECRKHQEERKDTLARYNAQYNDTQRKQSTERQQIEQEYERDAHTLRQQTEEARWLAKSVLDTDSNESPRKQLESYKARLAATKNRLQTERQELANAYDSLAETLKRRRQWWEPDVPPEVFQAKNQSEASQKVEESHTRGLQLVEQLNSMTLSRFLAGGNLMLFGLAVWLGCTALLFFFGLSALQLPAPREPLTRGMIAGAVGIIPSMFVGLLLYAVNRARVSRRLLTVRQTLSNIQHAYENWCAFAKQEADEKQKQYRIWHAASLEDQKNSLAKIEAIHARKTAALNDRRDTGLQTNEDEFGRLLQDIIQRRDAEVAKLDAEIQRKTAEWEQAQQREIDAVTRTYTRACERRLRNRQRDFAALLNKWAAAYERLLNALNGIKRDCAAIAPPWSEMDPDRWTLPTQIPGLLPFGHFECDLEQIPDGLSEDDQLNPNETLLKLPAALSFPERGSLLYKCSGAGKNTAVESMRALMLRFLTSLPPGKVRFTVIDPAGLGESFSAFMHLADYDEHLIGNRIWTEPSHIEKRLGELSEHMENIFQAYLRNEFLTIDEYNQQAGEVAEPYHFLVVANFPANFTELTARRLMNIVTSGPRCGVYTLMSIDTAQPVPHNFDLSELERHMTVLEWKQNRFTSVDPMLSELPLMLHGPPEPARFSRLVHMAGQQSKDSRRVEVPFQRVAPADDEVWTADSSNGLDVPLGRAGAAKLQSLSLGRGTSQHVLVAGKTGAGKSSLLHALITNVALHYPPDQVEFCLIDFKKGVEFKTYASHGLPHARVIGIESDREFGVSVLERLDTVLKERGDLFRAHGVQDLPAFRALQTGETLPRILLIVDEFQEFFVEDDRFSQTASLLLDRLIRQGRAFGIHVLLGSQTLAGAYSLARSTIGQVAVRIALQCSDSDAHLILSEENTAARLLRRPGEAIYNDANGLVEGNHPFQVAWLPDEEREVLLKQLRQRAAREHRDVTPPIVFEGNVASDPRRNPSLVKLIEAGSSNGDKKHNTAASFLWLGESVSMKPPAKVEFRSRPGDNLLLVGQDPESARGILSTALLTLAAELPAETNKQDASSPFTILCGESLRTEQDVQWQTLADVVAQDVSIGGQRDAGRLVTEIADEVRRRADDDKEVHRPLFLLISDLSKFRDLRNDRDDFGFSSMNDSGPQSAGAELADVLRDGPAVGVHTIVWCDSWNNLNRWFGLQAVREFEMRVAFQMNAADSSNVIDSPAASRLGPHRALLYRGETGQVEKFRPYAAPSAKWLNAIASPLRASAGDISTWDDLETLTVK